MSVACASLRTRLLLAALAYAARGVPVFPCAVGSKAPATRNGFKDASTSTVRIHQWWRDEAFNLGIPTGAASGLFVLDVDLGGEDAARALSLPPGAILIRTPSGAYHLWFAHPGGAWPNTASKIAPHVDTRCDGGYVLVPPSVVDGRPYVVERKGALLPVPQNILDALAPKPVAPRAPRAVTSMSGYVEAALVGECARVSNAKNGTRNHALNAAAFSLGQLVATGDLDEGIAVADLTAAAATAGLGEIETIKSIRSGLTAGMRNPRPARGEGRS